MNVTPPASALHFIFDTHHPMDGYPPPTHTHTPHTLPQVERHLRHPHRMLDSRLAEQRRTADSHGTSSLHGEGGVGAGGEVVVVVVLVVVLVVVVVGWL